MTRTVAVLAGGRGTRVASLTGDDLPKALLEVGGAPFLHHKLEEVHRLGADHAVLLVGRHGDQIAAFVDDGSRWDLTVDIVHDGPRLVGTGGALKRAAAVLPPRFWVTYGDSLLDVDLAAAERLAEERGWPAVMSVLHNRDQWQPSNVSVEGGVVVAYGKSAPPGSHDYLDYGYLYLQRQHVNAPTADVFDLAAVLEPLIAARALGAVVARQRFHDIGTPDDVTATDRWLRSPGRSVGERRG